MMGETLSYNMGDILATFVIGGFFLALVLAAVMLVKNRKHKMHPTELAARIEELEKRVGQLENENRKA